ncbi:hypothetical protein PILCRDRAFT_510137 [Piloderma croceum F 1598]|uniref:Uncharacterized protein n=1 Tax=Piloderma croceum (strain F 1598) TaxID=765440 RepID=A0A0C3FML1_PILCF|nr:hypothetical protein PILCRDRAFT_510137 [Piloderma croceum F 1598]
MTSLLRQYDYSFTRIVARGQRMAPHAQGGDGYTVGSVHHEGPPNDRNSSKYLHLANPLVILNVNVAVYGAALNLGTINVLHTQCLVIASIDVLGVFCYIHWATLRIGTDTVTLSKWLMIALSIINLIRQEAKNYRLFKALAPLLCCFTNYLKFSRSVQRLRYSQKATVYRGCF